MEKTLVGNVQARLGLWDALSIIVGIIIGVGIFQTPPSIFQDAPSIWAALATWAVGGFLALVGAFCFAELSSTFPRSGGEYVYLTRAFGSLMGYLFAWAQLTVIRPGSIGALAFVFANQAAILWGLTGEESLALAALSILALSIINILGVTLGKTTQNLLTLAKVLGLVGIIVVGFGWGEARDFGAPVFVGSHGWFATGMILVLWTYAGRHEAAYIAAEVKNRSRNVPLALVLGTAAVTVIYLLINVSFFLALGPEGVASKSAAANVLGLAMPHFGPQAMSVLIMVSALGAINGMIFTTARIYAEFGADHRLFVPLSKWSRSWGTPVRALVVQGLITLGMVLGIGIWGQGQDTFEELINVTAAVFWFFFLMTGISLIVLRRKEPDLIRPFRVPLYPWLPLIFCAWCAYMMYGSIRFRPEMSLVGLGMLVAGLPFFFVPQKAKKTPITAEPPQPVGV